MPGAGDTWPDHIRGPAWATAIDCSMSGPKAVWMDVELAEQIRDVLARSSFVGGAGKESLPSVADSASLEQHNGTPTFSLVKTKR